MFLVRFFYHFPDVRNMIDFQQYKYNNMEFNVLDQFKEWYRKYDDIERCRLVKEKSIQVNNAQKSMSKAVRAEYLSPAQRTGVRGGKFTTLVVRSQKATEKYLRLLDELKYMVAVL